MVICAHEHNGLYTAVFLQKQITDDCYRTYVYRNACSGHIKFSLPLLLLQLTVALHLSSSMELWAIKTRQRGQRVAINVMMVLPWKEEWQRCVEQMAAGIPAQYADHK